MTATHRLRATTLALGLAALGTVLAACGPLASATTGSPPTGNAPATTPRTPPTKAPPTTHNKPPAGPTRCTAGHLHVSVAPAPGSGAAGHFGLNLVFTNTWSHPCTIYGYPGVSFVTGASGSQINDPAMRSPGTPGTVTLAPNGRAHALLLLVNTDNYNASSSCAVTTAAGVRVYPPDDIHALFAAYPVKVCSVRGTGVATIYPVLAGAGDS